MALRNNVDELFRRGDIMTYKFKIVCWIIVLILYRSAAIGDVAPLVQQESGGAVSPVSDHASIRMDSEQVTMRLEEDSYSVDAEFVLYNTGETVTELVGFPKANYVTTQEHEGPTNYLRFETWVNGEKAEIINSDCDSKLMTWRDFLDNAKKGTIKKGTTFPSKEIKLWLVHRVKFPGHAFTKIRTKYQSQYFVLFEQVQAIYIVGTGRHWKDRIGKAVFVIDCSGVGGAQNVKIGFGMAPGPRLISGGLLVSEIRNIKPEPRAKLSVRVLKTKE
jgi:hypothetical protein